ncbi:MAG: hypothetical protein KDI51_21155, partial [Xanthomonadales bacterium]|nr:hypothetical protein [Xanthomonadales bacterium]
PGVQPIAQAVEVLQRLLQVVGDLGTSEQAAAQAGIQPGFDALSSGRFAAVFGQASQLGFELTQGLLGKAVGEPEGD